MGVERSHTGGSEPSSRRRFAACAGGETATQQTAFCEPTGKRLGHAKPNIALRMYAHLFQKNDGKAAAAINAIWSR